MNEDQLNIKKVKCIFNRQKLTIPPYQRPYCWTEKSVNQLIDDLSFFMNQSIADYRLGNLIIHKDKDEYNIVDGQQRLTTLSIILYCIDNNYENELLKSEFNTDLSVNCILENKKIIENKLQTINTADKEKLRKFILCNCEFVYIELNDLSEAFQLFDSQNARGKQLEAYDLLKAFHLREMVNEPINEKLDCVKKWEKCVDNDRLGKVLGNNLYRIRKWSKKDNAFYLDKDNIDEFKGINLDKVKNYPYLKSYLMNIRLTEELTKNPLLDSFNLKLDFPFQINQIIINGKCFFKYVHYYSELFDLLFHNKNTSFYSFYENYSKGYDGSYRQGDIYVRELYEAIIMTYYDRFGYVDFNEAFVYLYKWCYALRLRQSSVFYSSINKYINEKENDKNKFATIQNNYHPINFMKERISLPALKEEIIKKYSVILEVFNQK